MTVTALYRAPIGIIVNEHYSPSVLAADYIRRVVTDLGYDVVTFGLPEVAGGTMPSCHTIFNVYYGDIGDGGPMSGFLEQAHVPFVGNSQRSCAAMYNKVLSKLLFERHGLATPSYWFHPLHGGGKSAIASIEARVGYPALAKPTTGAASEGIELLRDRDALVRFWGARRDALESGAYFIERFIVGRELSAGYVDALGMPLAIAEIHVYDEPFQTTAVKFSTGRKENRIPASLWTDVHAEIDRIVATLHGAFECSAFSRIDLIYADRLYLLEINGNPGLLETSLLPLMAKARGVLPDELFQRMIDESVRRCDAALRRSA